MDDFLLPESIALSPTITTIAEYIHDLVKKINLSVVDEDLERSWGGFMRFDRNNITAFLDQFFIERKKEFLEIRNGLDPKILIIAPGQSTTWRYHERRDEIWRVVFGPVAMFGSMNNNPPLHPSVFDIGNYITIEAHERHRLVGLQYWGIVAEIWRHTDLQNPSDEEDIIRPDFVTERPTP